MRKPAHIISIFFVLLCTTLNLQSESFCTSLPIKKVILWGHKLHTHTHSYIHWGFYRAFTHLGYDTYWFDNNDDLSNFDFSNSLFITEGQVDQQIPIQEDCFYIIHNCYDPKYNPLKTARHCIVLQVYTNDCLDYKNLTKLDDCIYYDLNSALIHMPWATDLLPHEIEANKQTVGNAEKLNEAIFIGTYCHGVFGNINQIDAFKNAAAQNNITFRHSQCCSMEDNIAAVKNAYMAPAIQGEWQVEKGYIPCRIFKNISYGAFGITNSEKVYELFQKKIIYNPDEYQLFYDAKNKLDNLDINELYELMDFVKEKHTYINRIQVLLSFFEAVYYQRSNFVI